MDIFTDKHLIARALKDDRRAIEALVGRYMPVVYGYSLHLLRLREDAADATQDVFVKAWRNLPQFDQSKSFRPWIITIAKHTCLDYIKKKSPLPFSSLDFDENERFSETIADPAPQPDRVTDRHIWQESINKTLNILAPQYTSVIRNYIFDGLTFTEIAKKTQESLNTVKSRYRRGIAKMRKIITK